MILIPLFMLQMAIRIILSIFLITIFLVPSLVPAQAVTDPLISIAGQTQGTTYQIKYRDMRQRNLKRDIERLLLDIDKCVSNYRADSEIAQFNQGHSIAFQRRHFLPLLQKSLQVYKATNGAFDPTVYPLVKAYGFGPSRHRQPITNLDSLLSLVGFHYITFDSISVAKVKEHIQLDFNAIAKGYTVDQVALFLEENGVHNYLVEIGGELRSKGAKLNSEPWMIGIENPVTSRDLVSTITLHNKGMATSGNYRNRYPYQGEIINHILNPKTGSYEASDLLSATVLADEAALADAYATAFMVMGLEKTKQFLQQHPELDAYLIYRDTANEIKNYATKGIMIASKKQHN
jgi:thiamine biosynthesis lipoprotein